MNIDLAGKKYKKPISNSYNNERNNGSRALLIIILIIVFVWGGVLFFKKKALVAENSRFENSISVTSQRIKELTSSENPAKKIALGKSFNNLKKKSISWSAIMSKIVKLETPGISVRDFSVSDSGEVRSVFFADSIASIKQFVVKLNTNKNISNISLGSMREPEKTSNGLLEVSVNFNLNI